MAQSIKTSENKFHQAVHVHVITTSETKDVNSLLILPWLFFLPRAGPQQ